MNLRLIRAAARAETSDDLHVARLLILLSAVQARTGNPTDGIMKIAKLDFLLRYPNCLEKALIDMGRNAELAVVKAFERNTVETKMMRFRYGPWDKRYRRWIGLMVAKGLAETYAENKKVFVLISTKGLLLSDNLCSLADFEDVKTRSDVIARYFGRKKGTWLKDFIYRVFPEILDMKWGDDISL